MDRSLSMEEASASSQVNDNHIASAYSAGQKKKINCINQQHRQHEGSSAQLMSSSPEREPYLELERRGSNEASARRRPSHSGSGFLGTMR